MGDGRQFTKTEFKGRLSLITEDAVHSGGVVRYAVQFTAGELSNADGVGFVFSSRLPVSKNIQQITSIFMNRAGQICLRGGPEVMRSNVNAKQLELGDWIEVIINLDEMVAKFTVWPDTLGAAPSSAIYAFGPSLAELEKRNASKLPISLCGHLACVAKNIGVMVTLGS